MHRGYSNAGDIAWDNELKRISSEQDVDLIFLAGDNGSHHPDLELEALKTFHENFPKSKIYFVLGNHSWWNGRATPAETLQYIRCGGLKYGARYLPETPLVLDEQKTLVVGLDGWYAQTPTTTNDRNYIPDFALADPWLRDNAETSFNHAIRLCTHYKQKDYRTILVTHFPFFEGVVDWKGAGSGQYFGAPLERVEMLGQVDIVYFGHSHRHYDGIARNGTTHLINPGSDYCKPSFVLIDL